eukprot:m.828263 g.828263  ORF g.828263 m.828263 type:complete len:179 (+) comp59436_c0_seq2:2271-2807(+)
MNKTQLWRRRKLDSTLKPTDCSRPRPQTLLLRPKRVVVVVAGVVSKIRAEYETLAQEDKNLERTFKNRKDFAEHEQYIDALFRLYKKRSKRAVGQEQGQQLSKEDCPEGLDASVWKRFLELRDQKIAFEAVVRAKAAELAEGTGFVQQRVRAEEQHARLVEDARNTLDTISANRDDES